MLHSALVFALTVPLRLWHLISPCLGNHCRYWPTCSCYAVKSIERFGPLGGSILALRRVMRCSSRFPGGIDPVPNECQTTFKTTKQDRLKIWS